MGIFTDNAERDAYVHEIIASKAVTLAKHGNLVQILCDDDRDAYAVLMWLESLPEKLSLRTSEDIR
jgi:hypothetical protein